MKNVTKLVINGVEYTVTDSAAVAFLKDQALTEEQKAQARENISALGFGYIPSKNLANIEWKQAGITNGVFIESSKNTNASAEEYIPVEAGETYAFSCQGIGALSSLYLYVSRYDAGKNYIDYIRNTFSPTALSATHTMTDDTAYIRVGVYSGNNAGTWENLIPQNFQIEKGTVATDYEKPGGSEELDNRVAELLHPIVEKQAFDSTMLNQVSNTVRSIAHRGDPIYAPQCTAPAYIVARKHGHSIMENDVMPTEDGQLVMWHDSTLSKLGNLEDLNGYYMYTDGASYYWVNPSNNSVHTYDTDYVASGVALSTLTRCVGANYGISPALVDANTVKILPFDVLRRIDFGVWFDAKYKGTQILTFEEWIMLCKQLGCEAYVDHKLTYAQITDDIVTEMASIVKRCGMGDFTSWLGISDIARINKLRETIPNARVGILHHPTEDRVATYATVNTGRGFFFNGDAKNGMTAEAIQLGINAGFDVEVWYVDYGTASEETIFDVIRTAVSYGVTGITADHYRVDEAFKYLLEQY